MSAVEGAAGATRRSGPAFGPADAQQSAVQPVTISLVNTVAGPKVDVAVRVGDDPAKVFLQRHIVRGITLTGIKG